jgi:phospholipid-binding lipoprotein MlaA
LQTVNVKAFELTHSVDKAVFRPVALAYRHGLPAPVRSGLRNILANLNEPVVFANYLLQHHPGKAAETLGRFTINSVVGVAGLFDVAKTRRFNLPHRPNGFADTLGFYGVKPGPFFYLPLIGPSSVRDLFGDVVDRLTLPLSGRPFNRLAYSIPTTTIRLVDRRAEFDDRLQKLHEDPARAYGASRAFTCRCARRKSMRCMSGTAPLGRGQCRPRSDSQSSGRRAHHCDPRPEAQCGNMRLSVLSCSA